MALESYRQKRNFRITPEPEGRLAKRRARGLTFVIQEHAASRLHYDFRLELNGVFLSWAVPKGPSLDPGDKRLAIHVEDHPIEYGKFEGVIPPKQYGAGTVLLWDRGIWLPKANAVTGYKKGKLKFELRGEKLRGGWMLVRSHGGKYGEKAWLLIKENDHFARRPPAPLVVDEKPKSVTTGRTIEEIATQRDRTWHSSKTVAENVESGAVGRNKRDPDIAGIEGAVRATMPRFIKPQLATLVKQPPAGDEWIEEMKYDGYRMLSRIANGEAQMFSRNGKDWTGKFGALARAAARLPIDNAWLDGEVVVLDGDGRSSFQALQNALSLQQKSKLYYYVFDLPYLNGFDLRKAVLLERKRLLESLLEPAPGNVRFSSHLRGEGVRFFREACRLGLEGVVAKFADSTYYAGRNRNWVKVKCGMRQEMVIGGYTDPEGSRSGLGALLLGVYEANGKLRYSGKVGTGFDHATLVRLRKKLDGMVQRQVPFSNPPRGAEARRAHWVKPELVAEVTFTEWTDDGTLRHPSFQGLREDKQAAEVVRERPTADGKVGAVALDDTKPNRKAKKDPGAVRLRKPQAKGPAAGARAKSKDVIAGITLTHPTKLLYPDAGISKRDLALYYEAVADWMMPHLYQRPLTLLRCPSGWQKECFFQKKVGKGVHDAIDRVNVQTS